jgi:hypothetical protein
MAKAKAKKKKGKTKVRDLSARKKVKGLSKLGGRRTGDPCDGGEIASKIS